MKRLITICFLMLLIMQWPAEATTTYRSVPTKTYPTIRAAMSNIPSDVDVVIIELNHNNVFKGPNNINIVFPPGKKVTVQSQGFDPANPNQSAIDSTIIDCEGLGRAFLLQGNQGPDNKIMGITIRNGYASGTPGLDGNPGCDCLRVAPGMDPNRACPGESKFGDGAGGAILLGNPTGYESGSPTIRNCVIKDCLVTGAAGGNGAKGLNAIACYGSRNGQWGGHGGRGSGRGLGGAIACTGQSTTNTSNPVIIDCNFMNNVARGGTGGDGNDGGNAASGGFESGTGDGGDGIGDGQGGAIYCTTFSKPTIRGCTFINNIAKEGVGGIPGLHRGTGAPFSVLPPGVHLDGIPGDSNSSNVNGTGGIIAGGGIYCAGFCLLNLTDSNFTENKAYNDNPKPHRLTHYMPGSIFYTNGGGVFTESDCDVNLARCDFINNQPGAVYCGSSSNTKIRGASNDKSIFRGNSDAVYGGAVHIDEGSDAVIQDCIFENNSAYNDGGAVECRTNVKVTGCSFNNNVAEGKDGEYYGYGGGMDAYDWGSPVDVNFTLCSFVGNHARIGGGFSTAGSFDANFNTCIFMNNIADGDSGGGALDLDGGSFRIRGGNISGNIATKGVGGALLYSNPGSTAIIRDCSISENSAGSAGGAIYFWGGASVAHQVFNCLMTDNFAADDGGAIYCAGAKPQITNCTFNNNSAANAGGAIFSDSYSVPTVTNSIFYRCDSHAIHDNGKAIPRYNLFYNNADGAYYDANDGKNEVYDGDTGPYRVQNIPRGSHNIYGDPLFVTGILGHFYLRQTPGQPPPRSPAVDQGSDTAIFWGLNTYTTSTAEDGDESMVDIGYHYITSNSTPAFHLDTGVVGSGGTIAPADGNYPVGATVMLVAAPDPRWRVYRWTGTNNNGSVANTNEVTMLGDEVVTVQFERYSFRLNTSVVGGVGGTIEPVSGNYYDIGTIVTLTATPSPGWRVLRWTGTDNNASVSNTNTVTINGDKAVSVEFELLKTFTVGTDCDYPTIHEAIAAAKNGDTVLVSPGVWYSPETAINKSITIRSVDPNHPENTILDGERLATRIFRFGPSADSSAVVDGFTLQNCYLWPGVRRAPEDPYRDGHDGWPIEGGAIYIERYATPVIKNCIIRNNFILGGHASNGLDADANSNAGRGGWSGWARGGGVYCAPDSRPTFINCQIINNTAIGGNGGNGGGESHNGGSPNYGGDWSRDGLASPLCVPYFDSYSLNAWCVPEGSALWKEWRWDAAGYYVQYYPWLSTGSFYGDYRFFSGYGGGVYCDINTQVTFINCTINGNRTQGGLSGVAGSYEDGGRGQVEHYLIPFQLPSYGGGVYCAGGSTVKFSGCDVSENVAARPDPCETPYYHLDPYLGHGGGIAAEDTATLIIEKNGEKDSRISGNKAAAGGGLWWTEANPKISNSSFIDNKAYNGGGLYGVKGTVTISNCLITGNEAFGEVTDANGLDSVDPNNYDPNNNRYLPGNGGGIHCDSVVAKVADCNISGNEAGASGGGAYFIGENINHSMLKNCLLTGNKAGDNGGGLSTNTFYKLDVSICTITNNTVEGGKSPYYGGGVLCSDRADTDIVHSIVWNNSSELGPQMAIKRGGGIATIDVNYSDIQGGATSVYMDSGCVLRGYGVDSNNLSGTSLDDPLFLGSYYLDQNRPCVNAGDPCHNARYFGMYKHTTRTDKVLDTDRLDLGYHHILTTVLIGDLDFDGDVDWSDYEIFKSYYNSGATGCEFPDWCEGADLNQDGIVDHKDRDTFADNWRDTEKIAPHPNPMTWAVVPHSTGAGQGSITMKATKATDNSGAAVQYYFDEVTGNLGGDDSGWQDSNDYTDSGLTASTTKYGYRVKARDTSNYTVTEWSFIGYAVPGEALDDTTPPTPNPMTWATAPHATSSKSIEMTATTAVDACGVEYLFDCLTTGGHDSAWRSSPTYQDVNLTPETAYTYTVKARDKSPRHNETAWSIQLFATTPASGGPEPNQPVVDHNAPTPNPSQWNVRPTRNPSTGRITMSAVVATDASLPVYYYFDCVNGSGLDSGWQLSEIYTYIHSSNCTYVVRTKDSKDNMGQDSIPWYTGSQ